MPRTAFALEKGSEAVGSTGLHQSAGDLIDILGIEITPPESLERQVVVGTEDAMLLGVEHPGIDRAGVIDLLRAHQGQALLVGKAAGVHVRVAHAAPVMRVALLDGALERGDIQRIGPPVEVDLVVGLQRIGPRLRDEGVGADIVAPEDDLGEIRHGARRSRRHSHQKMPPTATIINVPTSSSMAESWIHATAGTDRARNRPTRQMRQTRA